MKNLTKDEKTLIAFNLWIMYTTRTKEKFKHYDKYKNFRYWCVDLIIDKHIDYLSLPEINETNSNKIFNYCKKNIDFKSLEKMKTHEDEFINYENKITAVSGYV